MKKKFFGAALACVLAASLTACSGAGAPGASASSPASGSADSWKIGGIGPITGGAAVYGIAVQRGAEIAVDEINAAGGIGGKKIEFKFEDDEHDPEKSVNAYNSLKDWGMQALVGTTTSAPCIAVAAESVKDNLFQITPSGSAVECAANPNVFRVCFSDPDQGKASADYISSNGLAKKIGIIYDSSDVYSSGITEKFVAEAKDKGLEVVAQEQFTADSNKDFSTQLQKMKESGAELVFLPFYYTEASLVLTQANAMGYAPKFFGCDGMDGILNVDNFDKKLAEGLMLLTPFAADAKDELTVKFVKAYQDKYKEVPIQFAADGYDAVYAVKAAIEKSSVTPDKSVSDIGAAIQKAMTEIKLQGLTGADMTWNADGEPNKAPKAVKIENGVYVSMQ